MATFKDKLSSLISSQVPDFVLEDHPKFLQFLKTYYTFMEAAELSVTSVQTTDGIQLETETQNLNNLILDGSILDTDRTLLDAGDKILLESSFFGKFTRGETIQGQTSKAISTIFTEDLNSNRLFIVAQDKFVIGETILGLTSNASAVVNNYRPNPVNNIQELLNFRDPDKVISNFLSQFRNEFLTTLPENLYVDVDKRKLIKNIKSLYQSKGTTTGHKLFFKLLFNENSETILPREQILRVSDGKFSTKKILRCIETIGDVNNLLGKKITGQTSDATATIEDVIKFIIAGNIINEITLNNESILGVFQVGEEIIGVSNNDDDILIKSEITGIINSNNITNSGSLYQDNDDIEILGGGVGAIAKVESISPAGISEIIIDDKGLGYNIGDNLVFNNQNTNGAGAAGFIRIVNGVIINEDNSGDRIILEDLTTAGNSYEGNFIVQESSTGVQEITEIFLTNSGSGYIRLPTVTISTTSGINGILKTFGSDLGKIKKLRIIDVGSEYENNPSPTLKFKTNLIFIELIGTFIVDEIVTSSTGATGIIESINVNTNLIVLKNVSGIFTLNSSIVGGISNATATIKKSVTATANVFVGALADTVGEYINEDGHISESSMKVQDSLLYQDFSYLINVSRSIDEWRGDFKKTMHTSGFYFANILSLQSRLDMRAKTPVTGAVSQVLDDAIFSIVNTLFSTIFGRRLGTLSDGTTISANAKLGIAADLNISTASPFSNATRDVTLFREGIKLNILSRVKDKINGITIAQGFAYAGPRYGTINREVLRTFSRTTDTNYSIAELSANVTFGTRTSFDGQDNTFLFSSTDFGRSIKTKLTIPSEITSFLPENQFDNTATRFDQTIDYLNNPITFDDITP